MGQIQPPSPALLIVATISRHASALEWARSEASRHFGTIALASDAFDFVETNYYSATMGEDLKKQFLAFERPIDPAALAEIKCQTNDIENDYTSLAKHPETRPLNLDPGLLTPAKLILASTKDHAHRIYLRDGIYAELTLMYRHGRWQPLEWTYPDYRRADFQTFFGQCRDWLLNCGRAGQGLK